MNVIALQIRKTISHHRDEYVALYAAMEETHADGAIATERLSAIADSIAAIPALCADERAAKSVIATLEGRDTTTGQRLFESFEHDSLAA